MDIRGYHEMQALVCELILLNFLWNLFHFPHTSKHDAHFLTLVLPERRNKIIVIFHMFVSLNRFHSVSNSQWPNFSVSRWNSKKAVRFRCTMCLCSFTRCNFSILFSNLFCSVLRFFFLFGSSFPNSFLKICWISWIWTAFLINTHMYMVPSSITDNRKHLLFEITELKLLH